MSGFPTSGVVNLQTDQNIAGIRELILEDRPRLIEELFDLFGVSWS